MTLANNSIAAFNSVALNESQKLVLSAFGPKDRLRDIDISERLGLPINQITGRVAELILAGKLLEDTKGGFNPLSGRKCRVTWLVSASAVVVKPRKAASAVVALCVGCLRGYPRLIECAQCCAQWLRFDLPEASVKQGFTRIKAYAATAFDAARQAEFENEVRKQWAAL
jgi:hypothetical protein